VSYTELTREQLRNKRTIVPVSELHLWEENPREIKAKDYERLKEELQQGRQFKPLMVMQDGTVLGGNMRLRAMKELGVKNAWVTVIEISDEENKHVAYVNGERNPRTFTTKRGAMLHFALRDNEQFGYNLEQELAELTHESGLELEDYTIPDFSSRSISLKDMMDNFMVEEEIEVEDNDPTTKGEVICPRCKFKFEINAKETTTQISEKEDRQTDSNNT